MGINVYWDSAEKTIVRQDYGATWGWDEYEAAFDQLHRLVGEVDHPVSIIADVGKVHRIPADAIIHGARAVQDLPPSVRLCVVVTPSRLTITLLQAIQAVTRYEKIRIAASVEEARRMIALEMHVPNLKPN